MEEQKVSILDIGYSVLTKYGIGTVTEIDHEDNEYYVFTGVDHYWLKPEEVSFI